MTTAAVRAAVAIIEASDEAIDRATPLAIQETMKGPAVVLTDADPDDMLPVLERLAQRVHEAGLPDAVLTTLPTTRPFGSHWDRTVDGVKCWFVLRGTRPADWTGPLRRPAGSSPWEVDPADRLDAVTELVDWATSLPAPDPSAAVTSTGASFTPVPLTSALEFVRRTAEGPVLPIYKNMLIVTSGNEFRSVDFRLERGFAAAAAGTRNRAPLDWQRAVADTRQLLVEAGAWVAHGHLVRGGGSPCNSALSPEGARSIGNPMASRSFDWSEFITTGGHFDAYGVMRLPAQQRDQVEGTWRVTAVASGQILAEHPDPAAWFAEQHPDSEVLEAARLALGESLADRSGERVR